MARSQPVLGLSISSSQGQLLLRHCLLEEEMSRTLTGSSWVYAFSKVPLKKEIPIDISFLDGVIFHV